MGSSTTFFTFLVIFVSLNKNLKATSYTNDVKECYGNVTDQWLTNQFEMEKANIRFCIANCIGLTRSSSEERKKCLYNKVTAKRIRTVENKFDADPTSTFNVFCNYNVRQDSKQFANLTDLAASSLCTHIFVYDFADFFKISEDNFTLKKREDGLNIGDELKEVAENYDVKLHLSIGDFNSQSNKFFSDISNTSVARKQFTENMVSFLLSYKFTGIYLKWQYPVCWMNDCRLGPASDKKNFVLLLEELKLKMKPLGMNISIMINYDSMQIKKIYDFKKVSEIVDMIVVPVYYLHGPWENTVQHFATVNQIKFSVNVMQNFNPSQKMKFIFEVGYDFPIYQLGDATKTLPNSKSLGGSKEYNKVPGAGTFYQLCNMIKTANWTVSRTVTENAGFYAFKGDHWVSYEDVATMRLKAQYVRKEGMLGMGLIWVHEDDYTGHCGCGKFPLLRAVSEELRGNRTQLPNCT